VIASEVRFIAKNRPTLTEEQRKAVAEFLTALDDHDDVHRVYAGL
jgi:transcriptional/translational regulatory protein YebC/TACO1